MLAGAIVLGTAIPSSAQNAKLRLEQRAVRVIHNRTVMGYGWSSSHQLTIVEYPDAAGLSCRARTVDIHTGQEAQLKLARPISLYYYGFSVSPDGSKLAWSEGWPHLRIERVDGSGGVNVEDNLYMTSDAGMNDFTWTPDGNQLIKVTTFGFSYIGPHTLQLSMWDASRENSGVVIEGPDWWGPTSVQFLNNDEIRAVFFDEADRVNHIPMRFHHSMVATATISLKQPKEMHRIAAFEPPGDNSYYVREIALSPDGQRIAFSVDVNVPEQSSQTPISRRGQTAEIWMCSVTGSDMHEVAFVDDKPTDALFFGTIGRIRWSPDSKLLSCVHGGNICILNPD
jgi:hypothetical protein